RGGITFHHPAAFWFGVVTMGVVLALPMFIWAEDIGYRLGGTPIGGEMWLGMLLIMVGLAATAYGVFPKALRGEPGARRTPSGEGARRRVH
ncbi:MAG: hypothetical protein ACT4PO_04515, partial [Actinomycetota bacterium]